MMSENEAMCPAGSSERCGHGVPVRFVCTACVEAGAQCWKDPVPGRAYSGPYPNRAHRSVAELDARAPAAADHDVLAYLARRRGNAERVAGVTVQSDPLHELARDRARQLDVLIDEIRAGLHHGEAAAQAAHTGFDSRYLRDALGAVASDSVVLRLTDAGSPCRIEAEGADGDDDAALVQVVMPVRV